MRPRAIALGLVLAALAPPGAGAEPLTRARIDTPGARARAADLAALGFDVLEGTVAETSLEVAASSDDLAWLRAAGYDPVVLETGRPFRDIQAERAEADAVPAGYPTLTEILDRMAAAAQAHPAICRMVDITERYGAPATFEGRHLFAVVVSDNVALEEDEPAFLLVATHHCREIVNPVIALDALDRLTSGYGLDPEVTAAVDANEIWIAPVWNPDGYEYVFNVDNSWRKNRRVFSGTIGVDLNRNYPFGWSATCSGSTTASSGTYKGAAPGSEAETMIALAGDRHFARLLDFHSSGRETLHGYKCLVHPWTAFLRAEAAALSTASGYAGLERAPSAEGEDQEWQLQSLATHAFLTETSSSFQPSYASAIAEAATVWPGTLWLLARPISLSGHVRDACAGVPLVADITYPATTFQNGERNGSFLPFGRYHAFLPAGAHTIAFAAPGYAGLTFDVTVGPSTAELRDVALLPTAGCAPCSPASLTPRPRLLAVEDGRGGAAFTWVGEAAAPAYHLNSVPDKTALAGNGARRPPAGAGVAECSASVTTCVDANVIASPSPLLYYQVFSACGPSGLEEGPG